MDFIKSRRQPVAPPKAPKPAPIDPVPSDTENLLDRVCWAARAVHKQLGPGFDRAVYLNALVAEIQRLGLLFERDKEFPVTYHGVRVGEFTVDILIEGRLIAQVACDGLLTEKDLAAMTSRLRQAKLPLGLLADFGGVRLQVVPLKEPG